MRAETGPISAFEEGPLGWAVAKSTFRFPSGDGFDGRFTLVASKARDEWRTVHFHLSVGARTEDTVGRQLTT